MPQLRRRLAGLAFFGATCILSGVPVAALAHHGWSDYDADKTLTIKGRIKASSYQNPHATITLEADGRSYTVVLAPVSRMEARGAARDVVGVGKEITVVGYASKTSKDEIRAERIVFHDGSGEKTAELR